MQSDYAAGYDCANSDTFSGTPQSMEIETNEIEDIKGIPDNANPDKLKYNIDYSILQNLKNIGNLPTAEIQLINADTCSKDGEFKISAILDKKGDLKNSYSDVEILFAVPETSGICEITIEDINMNMTCQNTENFYISQIFIERQAVQDSEGNEIFFIEAFINSEQFACDISLKSNTKVSDINDDIDNANNTSTDKPTDNSVTRSKFYFRTNSIGLSGAGIAAIVICTVAVIAIVTILVTLNMKGALLPRSKKAFHDPTESSISKFVAN